MLENCGDNNFVSEMGDLRSEKEIDTFNDLAFFEGSFIPDDSCQMDQELKEIQTELLERTVSMKYWHKFQFMVSETYLDIRYMGNINPQKCEVIQVLQVLMSWFSKPYAVMTLRDIRNQDCIWILLRSSQITPDQRQCLLRFDRAGHPGSWSSFWIEDLVRYFHFQIWIKNKPSLKDKRKAIEW
jgi:hypothetical protein